MKMLFVFGLFVTSISAQAFEPSGSTSTISTPIASDLNDQSSVIGSGGVRVENTQAGNWGVEYLQGSTSSVSDTGHMLINGGGDSKRGANIQEQGTLSVRNSNESAEIATNSNSASTVDVRNSADTVEGQTV